MHAFQIYYLFKHYVYFLSIEDTIEIPPKIYDDTCWFEIVKNKKIIQFLRFDAIRVGGQKGGTTVYFLNECYKNIIYLVLAEITADYSKFTNRHAFLYNGDFSKENDSEFFGCLVDNRRTSSLCALHEKDAVDTHACRQYMNTFFRGRTDILRIYSL